MSMKGKNEYSGNSCWNVGHQKPLSSDCYHHITKHLRFRDIHRFTHRGFFFTDANNVKALLVVRDVILGSLSLYWDANSKEEKGIKFEASFERFPKKKVIITSPFSRGQLFVEAVSEGDITLLYQFVT